MQVTVHGHALAPLPPLHRADVTLQVVGDVLPRVQAIRVQGSSGGVADGVDDGSVIRPACSARHCRSVAAARQFEALGGTAARAASRRLRTSRPTRILRAPPTEETMFKRTVLASTTVIAAGILRAASLAGVAEDISQTSARRVYASFDLSRPQGGPFPSDIFTVADATQMTGRRLNYPPPDCAIRPTDCEDLVMVNSLDGWGLSTTGLDPVHRRRRPGDVEQRHGLSARRAGGPADRDQPTDLGSRYPHAPWRVGRGARPASQVCSDRERRGPRYIGPRRKGDERLPLHGRQPRTGVVPKPPQRSVRCRPTAGTCGRASIIAASAFTTQSVTSVMERIRDSIKASTPPPADFLLGPLGERYRVPA